MPKVLKNISELPLTTCPLCGTKALSLKAGKRGLLVWDGPEASS